MPCAASHAYASWRRGASRDGVELAPRQTRKHTTQICVGCVQHKQRAKTESPDLTRMPDRSTTYFPPASSLMRHAARGQVARVRAQQRWAWSGADFSLTVLSLCASFRLRLAAGGAHESKDIGRLRAHSTVTVMTRPGKERMMASQVRVRAGPDRASSIRSYISCRAFRSRATCFFHLFARASNPFSHVPTASHTLNFAFSLRYRHSRLWPLKFLTSPWRKLGKVGCVDSTTRCL